MQINRNHCSDYQNNVSYQNHPQTIFIEKYIFNEGVLFGPPAGKPDSTQPAEPGNERRNRVYQRAQRSHQCWYYTFNFLRKRIGKNSSEVFEKERKFESLCSKRMKSMTEAHQKMSEIFVKMPFCLNLINFSSVFDSLDSNHPFQKINGMSIGVADLMKLIDREVAVRLFQQWNDAREKFYKANAEDLFNVFHDPLCQFLAQDKYSSLYDNVVAQKHEKMIQINEEYLDNIGLCKRDLFQDLENTEGCYSGLTRKYNMLNTKGRTALLDATVMRQHAKGYGFKLSDWSPKDTIDELINKLNVNGPLAIGGDFGSGKLKSSLEKIMRLPCGREIWNCDFNPSDDDDHTILVVGAIKCQNQAGRVFWPCPLVRTLFRSLTFCGLLLLVQSAAASVTTRSIGNAGRKFS